MIAIVPLVMFCCAASKIMFNVRVATAGRLYQGEVSHCVECGSFFVPIQPEINLQEYSTLWDLLLIPTNLHHHIVTKYGEELNGLLRALFNECLTSGRPAKAVVCQFQQQIESCNALIDEICSDPIVAASQFPSQQIKENIRFSLFPPYYLIKNSGESEMVLMEEPFEHCRDLMKLIKYHSNENYTQARVSSSITARKYDHQLNKTLDQFSDYLTNFRHSFVTMRIISIHLKRFSVSLHRLKSFRRTRLLFSNKLSNTIPQRLRLRSQQRQLRQFFLNMKEHYKISKRWVSKCFRDHPDLFDLLPIIEDAGHVTFYLETLKIQSSLNKLFLLPSRRHLPKLILSEIIYGEISAPTSAMYRQILKNYAQDTNLAPTPGIQDSVEDWKMYTGFDKYYSIDEWGCVGVSDN